MPKQCIFYDSQADTKEDAIPVWLVEALRTGDVVMVTRPGAAEAFRQDDVAIRVGVVCGACNHGWISRLEDRTKPLVLPMIKGETVALDTEAQATIASWTVKTAMVFEHTWGRLFPPYWRQDERVGFAKLAHHPPGEDTLVWTASYAGSNADRSLSCGRRGLDVKRPRQPVPVRSATLRVTAATASSL